MLLCVVSWKIKNILIQEANLDKWKKAIKSASMNNLHEVEIKTYSEFLTELDGCFKI
jgi:hypothetical protein